jgi:tripartite-type tricarboxylate transporter receptor subunit TctC
MPRSRSWLVLSAACVVAASACGVDQAPADAGGADYPSGPVTLTVPYTAGGPTDAIARALAECLDERMGAKVVVENRPGAAGTIGTSEMVQSKPDGQTLGMVSGTTAVAGPILQDDIDYTTEDLQPIALLADIPSVIAVRPDSPYQTAEALFEAAKAEPGSVTVAVPGTTTAFGVELIRLEREYGVKLETVPFEGGNDARNAVLGGNVDVLWDAASKDLLDNINAGQFKAIATGDAARLDYLDVPTLTELGYPKLVHSSSPFGLAAPAATSPAIVQKLEDNVKACVATDKYQQVVGPQFVPDEFVGSAALSTQLGELADAYREVK